MLIYQPNDYETEFDPEAYLKYYYNNEALSKGTRLSLFALPMFARIIQSTLTENERLSMIDIGCGPTIYSAVCFRNIIKHIILSDFCESNLEILRHWLDKSRQFDWSAVMRIVANAEGMNMDNPEKILNEIEEKTREVIKNGGIIQGNVHDARILKESYVDGENFDILVSIFCLEGACTTYIEYTRAFNNLISLIRPGGRLILGSVIEDTTYNAGFAHDGKPKIFSVLHLSDEQIMGCIQSTDLFDMKTMRKYSLEGVMFLMITKKI